MQGLDFGVQNRVGSVNSGYSTKPQGLQPVETKKYSENKRTFDKTYCQSVQAYFAPNFIKAGEKPCSVTAYTSKLKAAGLVEGKDFEVKGFDTENSFGLDIILKDTQGRIKKSTRWENGLEADNFTGYKKYSYNPLDASYRKITNYSIDNKIEFISEKTNAIAQKDFTPEGLNINMNPKEYAEILKSKGKHIDVSEQNFGENLENSTCIIDEFDENHMRTKSTLWYYENNALTDIEHCVFHDKSENVEKSLFFNPDGSTEMIHYFN